MLNGESLALDNASNLSQLIEKLKLTNKRFAIELNQQIVPRSQFNDTRLEDGDIIEIVQAIGGG